MGFWDKAKESFNDAKDSAQESMEEAVYTQEYSKQDAKQFADDMRNDVNPDILRRKTVGKAPLDYLEEGEKPQYLLIGFDLDVDDNDEGNQSQLLVTNKKVVMAATSITVKSSQYTVSFEDIIGLSVQRRMMSHIRIQTAGHSYKISAGGSAPELADEVVDYIRRRKDKIDTNNQESQEQTALDKLDKLADLRDRGVVSEEEFEQKKQNLMDEI